MATFWRVDGVTAMPNTTYFGQDCPTCGRKLNIRVEYLGRKVVCQHCRAAFQAWDSEGAPPQTTELSGTRLVDRATELLEQAETKIAESRILKRKLEQESADLSETVRR
jgi:hypothetical protein